MKKYRILSALTAFILFTGSIGSPAAVRALDDVGAFPDEEEQLYEEPAVEDSFEDGSGIFFGDGFDAQEDGSSYDSGEGSQEYYYVEEEAPSEDPGWISAEVEEAEEVSIEEDTEAGTEGAAEESPGDNESGMPDAEGELLEESAAAQIEYRKEFVLAEGEFETAVEEELSSYQPNRKPRRDLMEGVNVGAEIALYGDPGQFTDEDSTLAGGDLTSSYNLLEQGYVSPAKNQGENGSCWAYAALCSEESSACADLGKKAEEADDSEAFLAWFGHSLRYGEGSLEYEEKNLSTLVNPFKAGGTALESASFLLSSFGPQREDAAPPIPTTSEAIKAAVSSPAFLSLDYEDALSRADHLVTEVECLPQVNLYNGSGRWAGQSEEGIAAIKTALMEGHAVTIDILSPQPGSRYVNRLTDSLYVDNGNLSTSHQITIIGWDDSFPAGSFNKNPENDGAWICLNSWGNYEDDYKAECMTYVENHFAALRAEYLSEHPGMSEKDVTAGMLSSWWFARQYPFDENGCFYLSYYDRIYCNPTVFHADARSSHAGEQLLQYDYLGIANVTNPGQSEDSGCEANVFELEDDSDLRRVGVITGEAASRARIEVYVLYGDGRTPTDGVCVYTKEAVLRFAGYHTIEIDKTLTLPKGCRFSVCVTVTGPTGHPYTPYEYSGTDPRNPEYVYVTAENAEGQSYILKEDVWVDLKQYPMTESLFYLRDLKAGNACIKAYMGPASGTPVPIPTPTPSPTPAPVKPVTEKTFMPLYFRSTSSGKTCITLKWKKQSDADGYTIYGAKYGSSFKKLADTGGSKTSYKASGLKKNTYYKFYMESYKMSGSERVATAVSQVIYMATAGGKYTNYKSVKLNSKSKVSLKIGKSSKIKAEGVPKKKSLKISVKKGLRYESSNPAAASVSKKGKITAKKAGKASIIVYAQNGVYKTVRVTVK